MKIIRGLHNLKPEAEKNVLTIGNFDGVHLGHQAVISALKTEAKALGLPAMLMTFEPHPKEYFSPDTAPSRLTSFAEKMIQIQKLALDKVLTVKFNQAIASMSPEAFVVELLVRKLNVAHLLVGEDFQFGRNREGNFALLKEMAEVQGFKVETIDTLNHDGQRVSSTLVRELLSQGNFEKAKALLGRPYFMAGKVQYGAQKGRTIGFPTANLALKRVHPPIKGVFQVEVEGLATESVPGVANLGTRPTVDGLKTLLEVHLFDFSETIYGKSIKVIFKHKIRDEKKFDSFDALKQQIQQDVRTAKALADDKTEN